MRLQVLDIGEFARVAKVVCHDAVMSPLRKYVIYSFIFHIVLIGALSVTMLLPKKAVPPVAVKTSAAAEGETKALPVEAKTPAGPAKGEASKATGQKDDYFKRQGIDAAPAKASEIPKNPFEAKEELKKNLEDLK